MGSSRRVLKPMFWGHTPTTYQDGKQDRRCSDIFCDTVRRVWRVVYWFRNAIALGLVGATISVLLGLSIDVWHQHFIPVGDYIFLDPAVYTSFSFILGFILTFRTNQAYNRYWEGATLLEQMMGNWYDGVSALVAFCGYSSAPEEKIMEFQQVLARLLSLINAVILCELAGEELEPEALKYNLLDATGLDKHTLREIARAECRPELIFQQIQTLIVTNMSNGVLSVPPPILTRAFQQMGNAMLNFHDATKLRLVPFPAPYIAVAYLLTLVHIILTPIIAINWTYTTAQAAFISFVQIFIVSSLLTLAYGLDNPFDPTQSGLDLEYVHGAFNQRLTCLLADGPIRQAPKLSKKAAAEMRSAFTAECETMECKKRAKKSHFNDRHTLQEVFTKYNTETSIDSTVPPTSPVAGSPPPTEDVVRPPTGSLSSMTRSGSSKPNLARSGSKNLPRNGSKPHLTRSHTGTLTLPSLASPQIHTSGGNYVVKVDEESESDDDSYEVVATSPPRERQPAGGSGVQAASPDASPPALEIPLKVTEGGETVFRASVGSTSPEQAPGLELKTHSERMRTLQKRPRGQTADGTKDGWNPFARAASGFLANRVLWNQQLQKQQAKKEGGASGLAAPVPVIMGDSSPPSPAQFV